MCYHCDTDMGCLESLHTFSGKYLDNMLVKFEQNRMVQTMQQNFDLFDQQKKNNGLLFLTKR